MYWQDTPTLLIVLIVRHKLSDCCCCHSFGSLHTLPVGDGSWVMSRFPSLQLAPLLLKWNGMDNLLKIWRYISWYEKHLGLRGFSCALACCLATLPRDLYVVLVVLLHSLGKFRGMWMYITGTRSMKIVTTDVPIIWNYMNRISQWLERVQWLYRCIHHVCHWTHMYIAAHMQAPCRFAYVQQISSCVQHLCSFIPLANAS